MTLQDIYQWAEGVRQDANTETPPTDEEMIAAFLLATRMQFEDIKTEVMNYPTSGELWKELEELEKRENEDTDK